MSQTQVMGVVSTAVSVLALLVAGRLVWTQREDNLRDHLFALRDEMFLYALDEKILDTVAHRNLRLLMNRLIRYAHRVSLGRAILLDFSRRWLGLSLNTPQIYAEWLDAVDQLPADQAQCVRGFHDKAMLLMMKHMMSGSPLLWLGSGFVFIKHFLFHVPRMVVGSIANSLRGHVRLDLLEADALRSM